MSNNRRRSGTLVREAKALRPILRQSLALLLAAVMPSSTIATAGAVYSPPAASHVAALPRQMGSVADSPSAGNSILSSGVRRVHALPQSGSSNGITVSVAYADNLSSSMNFPTPWQGSPNVAFYGGGATFNAGAIRLDNPTASPITVDSVSVDLQRPGPTFSLWKNLAIPANGSAILTQTASYNFDTGSYPIVSCGGTIPRGDTRIPLITVSQGGTSTSYQDTAHVLDTGGFDLSCRGNRSLAWRPIGTTGIEAPSAAITAGPDGSITGTGNPVVLQAQALDAAGQALANASVAFSIKSGPNSGMTSQAVTDSEGVAQFSYASLLAGSDSVQASLANLTGTNLDAAPVLANWTSEGPCPAPTASAPGSTNLIYVGQMSAHVGDMLLAAALLTDSSGSGLPGQTISFTFQSSTKTATTDSTGVARTNFAALGVTTAPLRASFSGSATLSAANTTATVTVAQENTEITYTGPAVLTTGSAPQLTATLTDLHHGSPLANETLTFQVGATQVSAITNASGVATVSMTLPSNPTTGPGQVQVSFAGDTNYLPSYTAAQAIIAVASSFVIWGGNSGGLHLGQDVNFWGAPWASQVTGGSYSANPSFQGFAQYVASPNLCEVSAGHGQQTLDDKCWNVTPGNSNPPATLPPYIEVMASNAIATQGSQIYGNIASFAVLKVDSTPAYGSDAGHPGYGVIVAVIQDGAGIFPTPVALSATQSQPATVLPGQTYTVTTQVTNSGQIAASNVVVSESFDGVQPPAGSESDTSIASGGDFTASFSETAPIVPARQSTETSTAYETRLGSVDGRRFTSTGSITFTDSARAPYLRVNLSSHSRLQLPHLDVSLTGPACVSPSATVPYVVRITNLGSATASTVTGTLTLPDGNVKTISASNLAAGTSSVTTVKFELAAGALAQGTILTATANIDWQDAQGNNYGTVTEQVSSATQRIPIVSPTSAAPGASAKEAIASPAVVTALAPSTPVAFQYALFATASGCGAMNMSGAAYTDAFNSNVAPYSSQHNTTNGSIATEGNATLSGSATIGGTIYAANTTVGTGCVVSGGKVNQGISSSGSASCSSGHSCAHQQITTAAPSSPSVPTPTYSGTTVNISGGTTTLNPSNYSNLNKANSINISSSANVTFPAGTYYIYNLTVSGGSTITLGQGTYYLNSINLSGSSFLYLAMGSGQKGPVTLNVAGAGQGTPINLSGGTIVNQTLIASNLEIFYAGTGGASLSGGANAYFVVDAPGAAVTLSGTAAIYGAIIGGTINDSAGTAVHYDSALSQLAQTITFPNPGTQTYGVAPITLAATASSGLPVTYSVISGPATVSGSELTITGAGPLTVEADQAGNSSYLPAPPVQQTFAVNKAVLGVTASNAAMTYGGALPTFTATYSGFVNGDTVSVLTGAPSLATTATSASPSGAYPITAAQGTLAAANYTFSFTNGTLTIGQATLTVTAQNAAMIYGSTLPTFTATYSGFVNGDTVSVLSGAPSLTTTATSASPVGTYPITAAQGTLAAANYTFTFANATLTIQPAPVVVTLGNLVQTYSGSPEPVSVTTVPAGVSVTVSYTGINGTTYGPSSTAPTNPGAYTAAATVTNPNFAGGTSATLTINQLNPSLSLALLAGMSEPSPYGTRVYFELSMATAPCPTGQVQFFVDDAASGAPVALSGTNCTQPVEFSTATLTPGSHSVYAVYSGDTFYAGQTSNTVTHGVVADTTAVTLASSAGSVNVGQTVTFTATVTPSPEDPSATALSGTVQFYDGGVLLGGSALSAAAPFTASFSTAVLSAGTHSITATYVSANGLYSGSSSAVTVETVDKIAPAITWAQPADIVYGTALSNTQLNATASDNGNPVSGTFTYNPAAGTVLPVGTRNLQVTFTPDDSATYTTQTASVTINVTPAVLTVAANNASMTYGGSLPAFTASYSGFVNGDTTSVLTGAPSLATTATSASAVGNYPIAAAQGTLAAQNYSFAFVNGTLTVTQASQTITFPNPGPQTFPGSPITLNAAASSGLAVVYSVISGPATVNGSTSTITGAGSVTIEADQPGNTNYAAASPVQQSFTVQAVNAPPVVTAGPNQTVPFPNNYPLQGKVTSGNTPPGTPTALWTVVSTNPGGLAVTFTNPTSPTSIVKLNAAGTYVLQLTGTEKGVSASAHVTITAVAGNQPPVVNAGPDQKIELPTHTATLTGSATDATPNVTLIYAWSQISGPGTATIANPTSPATSVTFPTTGTYTFRLTVSDGQLTGIADTHVTEYGLNQPPVVNAGPNQSIALPTNSVTLNGSASDDGLPLGSVLTVSWSVVQGTGTVTFASPISPVTTATFSQAGAYHLRLSANDTQYTSTSDTLVTVNPPPPPAGGATLVLAPSVAGPNPVGSVQLLTATLKDGTGNPISGQSVTFTVTGPNATSGSATTSASGVASFSYTGTRSGTDGVQAQTVVLATTLPSNTASVSWLTPVQTISTNGILGQFFPNPGNSGTFNIAPGSTPVFTQNFPSIDFNPPSGTVPGNNTGINENTRPVFDVTTDVNGNFTGSIEVQGNGLQAGLNTLFQYEAVFTSTFTVAAAGNVTFNFYSDDGFVFGVGNGATRVSGALSDPPPSFLMPFTGVPVMGSYNQVTAPVNNSITVNFPAPGNYPYEVDYTECCAGQVALTMASQQTGGHGIPPAGSTTLSPSAAETINITQPAAFTAFVFDASGAPVGNAQVVFTVTGAHTQNFMTTSDATGHATFTYTAATAGADLVQAQSTIGALTTYSNQTPVNWNKPANLPPVVNAGPDQTIQLPINTVTLNGTVTDDGNPVGAPLTQEWSQIGGPGVSPANGYAFGKEIVVDHTKVPNTDQQHFPLLISGTYPYLATVANGGGVANASGFDIIFTSDATGMSPLPYERESYNPATGAAIFWVNIPLLSHTTDTPIYLFYGNSAITTDQSNKNGVWDSNFRGVWHLDETSGTQYDSTSSGNNSTGVSVSEEGNAIGQIGGADLFNSSHPDHVDLPNIPLSSAFTLELWMYPTSIGDYDRIFAKAYSSNTPPWDDYWINFDTAAAGTVNVGFDNNGNAVGLSSTSPIPLNQWTHVAGTYDGSFLRVFINGKESSSGAQTGTVAAVSQTTEIGYNSVFGPQSFTGTLDEPRISSIARSADWIATEFNNQSSPGTFYSVIGGLVTFSNPGQPATQATFGAAGAYVLQLSASDTQYTSTSNVTVTVYPAPPAAQPPVVSAGPSQTVIFPNAVTLSGSVTDSLLPPGAMLTSTWSVLGGPGTVTFGNATSPVTTASFSATGTYLLQLSASNTQYTSTATTTVNVMPAPTTQNQPPSVSASALSPVVLPNAVTLNGTATDDGLPNHTLTVQWSELTGPGTVTFANAASANTTATFNAAGTYTLQLSASDTQYTSSVTLTIAVVNAPSSGVQNQPPAVSAGPSQKITLPVNTATLRGVATDDGLPYGTLTIGWTEVSGPAPVTFGNQSAALTSATFSVAGVYLLQLSAFDGQYTTTAQTTVTVSSSSSGGGTQDQPPTVSAGPNLTVYLPSNSATLNGSASSASGSTLSVTWSEVSGPGTVAFSNPNSAVTQATFPAAGTYVLQLSATDGRLTAVAGTGVTVVAQPPAPPTVHIDAPTDGTEVTMPTPVTGTVSNGNWVLQYAQLVPDNPSAQVWTTFASGSGAASGTLGTLDPTILLNGEYSVELMTIDAAGQFATASISVAVDRNMKVGVFSLAFNDLSVPVSGFPIQITRSYDSRDKTNGDFGVGWRLAVANARVQKNHNLGLAWQQGVTFTGFLTQYCAQPSIATTVTVTFPDGKVYSFQPSLSPSCQLAGPITTGTLTFTQLPGPAATAGATLAPADGGSVLVEGDVPGPTSLFGFDGNIYNPTQFTLTTAQGVTYTLDQALGVTAVKDLNGNSLTITANNITSSTGKSVAINRNGQGFVTSIADPNGVSMSYTYDANNNLATYTDRASNTTKYAYDANHDLTGITLPNGQSGLSNAYDPATGRLTGTTDGNGVSTTFTHNVAAQTEVVTDRNGNATTYAYDTDGNVLQVTDALGHVTSSTYDSNDNKLTDTNALGKTSTYTYDQFGNRLTETDPLQHSTNYTYSPLQQVLTVADPLTNTTTNAYDNNGNLLTTKDALGNVTTNAYSPSGLLATTQDALHNTTSFGYDGNGNLTSQTDANNVTTSYTYDANGNRQTQSVTRTLPASQGGGTQTLLTQFAYDGNNRLTKTTYPDGTFTQVQYNSLGQQAATIDAKNNTTSYTYDNDGRLTLTKYPDTTTESSTYDGNGNRLTSTDRAGHVTTYTYDVVNRLTKTTYADNSFTETGYDAAGQVLTSQDANGNVTTYAYDDAGRRTSLTDALTHVTTFGYDAAGNQTTVQDANHNTTTYVYDSLNRRTQVTYPDSKFELTGYDALGRVSSRTDANGKVTAYGYDALGRLTSVTQDAGTGGLNFVTHYSYDEVGDRLTQTDANTHTTQYAYDQRGRRTGRALPLGQSEGYAYDANGNLSSRTDFNGRTTAYTYDTLNRLVSKAADPYFVTNHIGAASESFTYTATGKRASMTDQSGTTTYTYDTRDRLQTEATPEGTLSYSYDAAGDVKTIQSSNAGGASMAYGYDALDRLSTVTDANGATSYGYDAVGNLHTVTYPNSVAHSYTYDTRNRLTGLNVAPGSSSPALFNYAYTLDASGHRTSVTEQSGRKVNYSYDTIYRLTNETIASDPNGVNGAVSYTYDNVGNRLQKTSTLPGFPGASSTYNANDELTTDQYDADGNTIGSGLNTGTSGYVYDFENRLVQQGGISVVYDGDGNRVSKSTANGTTQYLVDDQNPTGYAQVLDEVQSSAVTRTYTWGMGLISEHQTINSTPTTSYYVFDGHGSIRALTNASGNITDSYDYDAFGILTHSSGTTPNNYLFAGEQFDPDLNLYYNRTRYLDTSTGRFWTTDRFDGVSTDPISLHKYLYVGANPVNRIDPSGKDFIEDVTAACGVIATLATNIYVQASTVLTTIYLNLWRLPMIVDQVSQYVTLASGAISIIHSASQALPELAHNLLESDQEYSSNPRARGFQVEIAAGANLSRTNADFDDFRYGELTQIKSTVQVQSKQVLIGLIRRAAQDLGETKGPYRLISRGGGVQTVQEEQVTGKNLLFVISDETLTFSQQSLLPELQQIEESTGVQIGVQAVQNLRGP